MKNYTDTWYYKVFVLLSKIDKLYRHYLIGERWENRGEDGQTLKRKNYFN
jgi:hypothetical protein